MWLNATEAHLFGTFVSAISHNLAIYLAIRTTSRRLIWHLCSSVKTSFLSSARDQINKRSCYWIIDNTIFARLTILILRILSSYKCSIERRRGIRIEYLSCLDNVLCLLQAQNRSSIDRDSARRTRAESAILPHRVVKGHLRSLWEKIKNAYSDTAYACDNRYANAL
jgi:hypothetical protein